MTISAFRLKKNRLFPLKMKADTPDEITHRLPNGLYTTFSTTHQGTRVLGLSAHLDRVYNKEQTESIHPSAARLDLCAVLSKLATKAAPGESRFRILLSSVDGMVYVIHEEFTPPSPTIYEKGVRVITTNMVRNDPRLKFSSFIGRSEVERRKVNKDVYEVLLTNRGLIYEGMTSNFFVINNGLGFDNHGTILTARNGILLGVTRRAVLRLAREQGMCIRYRHPHLEEFYAEAFITSSSRGVVPVISIDDRVVGEGSVGTWTRRLIQAYKSFVDRNSEFISIST